MRHRQHNRWTALLVAGALAGVVALTTAVDPVGLWGAPVIRGFNSFKVRQSSYEHTYKARAFALRPVPAVFLGASRVKYGLRSERYTALTGRAAFNFALGGVPLQLQPGLLAHAFYHRPDLQEVVLGVSYHDFLEADAASLARLRAEEGRLASPWPPFRDFARHGLTLTAIEDALATVRASRAEPDARAYEPDGHGLRQPLIDHLERVGARAVYIDHVLQFGRIGGQLAYEPTGIAWLQRVVDECRARGTTLTVFVPPVHATDYDAAFGTPTWAVIERSMREMARITPYWDFSGFNAISTDPIVPHMRYYFDVTHYRPAVGDRIFDRIYGGPGVLPGFGHHVTAATVEADLARLRRERAAWVATDPPARRFHAQLLAQARASRGTAPAPASTVPPP